jgi:hypothetical protein
MGECSYGLHPTSRAVARQLEEEPLSEVALLSNTGLRYGQRHAQIGFGIATADLRHSEQASSPACHPSRTSVYLKGLAQWMLDRDAGVVHMRETASIGASLDLVSARSAFKGLQLVCVAVERMRRPPGYRHRPSTRRASRPIMCTKPDLHKHFFQSPSPNWA